jgi:hypothetical protein
MVGREDELGVAAPSRAITFGRNEKAAENAIAHNEGPDLRSKLYDAPDGLVAEEEGIGLPSHAREVAADYLPVRRVADIGDLAFYEGLVRTGPGRGYLDDPDLARH